MPGENDEDDEDDEYRALTMSVPWELHCIKV